MMSVADPSVVRHKESRCRQVLDFVRRALRSFLAHACLLFRMARSKEDGSGLNNAVTAEFVGVVALMIGGLGGVSVRQL